jgi:protein-disulfide isomerase
LSRVGAVAFAATLLGLVAGGALAADPSPAIADPSAAPTDVPLPDLTMAPLVTLPPVVPALVEDPSLPSDGYVLGDPEAPVTIEVYADFQCPYCQRFALMEGPRIVDTWVVPGHARLVFRDFAFLGEESRWAAVAARLAAEQDHFWPSTTCCTATSWARTWAASHPIGCC